MSAIARAWVDDSARYHRHEEQDYNHAAKDELCACGSGQTNEECHGEFGACWFRCLCDEETE